MARRLRIQFPGAIYHVINRGNYRSDVFETADKARAFECVLFECAKRMGWEVFAYVLMRNHFHLAVRTPEPNLVEGMHWLQSTYATRFNRFRQERGHVFQGRYQSILVEPGASLLRVVNYIHLNPVRAKIIPAEQIAQFRWSSLRWFGREDCPGFLSHSTWLETAGVNASRLNLREYVAALKAEGALANGLSNSGDAELCSGWAIGTPMWRKALAEEHAQHRIYPGMSMKEIGAPRAVQWKRALEEELVKFQKAPADIARSAKGAPWKIQIAVALRAKTTATNRWIATQLQMGSASSVSQYVSRETRGIQLLEA